MAKYLSPDQLQTLAESFAVENIGENRVIFGQFENPAQALYVVAEGTVNLEVQHNTNVKYKPRPEDDDNEFVRIATRARARLPPAVAAVAPGTDRIVRADAVGLG